MLAFSRSYLTKSTSTASPSSIWRYDTMRQLMPIPVRFIARERLHCQRMDAGAIPTSMSMSCRFPRGFHESFESTPDGITLVPGDLKETLRAYDGPFVQPGQPDLCLESQERAVMCNVYPHVSKLAGLRCESTGM